MNAREAADAAQEAIHALNYATMPWDGYPGLEYPSDVYDVVGSLSRMAAMLPQALAQVANWIKQQATSGKIKLDDGSDLARAVDALNWSLGTASGEAVNLHVSLDKAHVACNRMAAS